MFGVKLVSVFKAMNSINYFGDFLEKLLEDYKLPMSKIKTKSWKSLYMKSQTISGGISV